VLACGWVPRGLGLLGAGVLNRFADSENHTWKIGMNGKKNGDSQMIACENGGKMGSGMIEFKTKMDRVRRFRKSHMKRGVKMRRKMARKWVRR
jgi:hypothetical protein